MRITSSDGVGLRATVTGQGPALLLVHGFGGAKEDFAEHVDRLAADHTVVTFDHRGHGASDAPDTVDAYSLDQLAADTLAVADALALDRFHLLGHSMGGMVARRVVLAAPHRVSALILMDTSPGPIDGFDPELMELAAEVALRDGMGALRELLDMAQVLETPAHRRALEERPGYQAYNDEKWAALAPAMWAALACEIARQPDELELLAAVTCATLVVVGEQDEPFLGAAHAMRATIAGAQLAVIPDAGHSPQIENSEVWSDVVTSFLDACRRTLDAGTAGGAR